MIEFRAPTPTDKAWAGPLLEQCGSRGCGYDFPNIYIWQKAYGTAIAQVEGMLAIRMAGPEGPTYMLPVGPGDLTAALRALEADAAAFGEPLCLVGIDPAQRELLEGIYPGRLTFEPQRDSWDYLYDIDRLADLGGKKLHAKRNHINRFIQNNPSWVFEPITRESLPECMEMDREWYRRSLVPGEEAGEREQGPEGLALHAAVANYEELGLEGGLIRVYGEVVAFTIGDKMAGDTYDVHFEKAYGELQGAYAMINREFARWVRDHHPEVRYLNREEDLGVEGLRKAKESYYPDLMAEKYTATLR